MGSCCSKVSDDADHLGQYSTTGRGDDESSLLAPRIQPSPDVLAHLATTPAPLLSGVNFAIAPDEDLSDSSIDNDEIEQMLADDHESDPN
jgi:hypothetical protein